MFPLAVPLVEPSTTISLRLRLPSGSTADPFLIWGLLFDVRRVNDPSYSAGNLALAMLLLVCALKSNVDATGMDFTSMVSGPLELRAVIFDMGLKAVTSIPTGL